MNVEDKVFNQIELLIKETKSRIYLTINSELVILYWNIGKMIDNEVLKNKKAEYGNSVVKNLAKRLTVKYGAGFSRPNIYRMISLSNRFENYEKISTLSRKLSWSHFIELLQFTDDNKLLFYTTMAAHETWSVRMLRERISSALYERTLIAKKTNEAIRSDLEDLNSKGKASPELFLRDPYNLAFLNLEKICSEQVFEDSLIKRLEKFILELGTDFAFLARQKRIIIGGVDYYIDLLFYHRALKRMVAIELKLDRFKSDYKGQLELYLKYLNKYEKQPGEKSPIGIILCASKNKVVTELLDINKDNIHIAEYITKHIPRKLLEEKLIKEIAKSKFSQNFEKIK